MQLTLGLVPLTPNDETRSALERVATAIEGVAGLTCDVHMAQSPAHLAEAYGRGATNVVWASPTLILLEPAFRRAVPVATSVREGHIHYHGVLFVRRDGDIRGLMDLRGARAAWVAKSSSSGYIFPRVALAGVGINADEFLGAQQFHGSHGAVIEAVLSNQADVGAVYASFEDGDCTRSVVHAAFVDMGCADEVRVLLPSQPVPADVIVVHPDLRAQLGPTLVSIFGQAAEREPAAFEQVFGTAEVVAWPPHQLDELRGHVHHARELGVID